MFRKFNRSFLARLFHATTTEPEIPLEFVQTMFPRCLGDTRCNLLMKGARFPRSFRLEVRE